ncbi:MAG TPA: 3-hydroxybutyryl-CoA dehydrogenase, partial [Candidatus Thalassarchaeaceae archaeon]
MSSLAVLGAGQMGAGIAQVAACSGIPVVMIDIKQEYLDRGFSGMEKSLSKLVSKGRMTQEEAQ